MIATTAGFGAAANQPTFTSFSSAACWVGQNHSDPDSVPGSLWRSVKPGVCNKPSSKV